MFKSNFVPYQKIDALSKWHIFPKRYQVKSINLKLCGYNKNTYVSNRSLVFRFFQIPFLDWRYLESIRDNCYIYHPSFKSFLLQRFEKTLNGKIRKGFEQ